MHKNSIETLYKHTKNTANSWKITMNKKSRKKKLMKKLTA